MDHLGLGREVRLVGVEDVDEERREPQRDGQEQRGRRRASRPRGARCVAGAVTARWSAAGGPSGCAPRPARGRVQSGRRCPSVFPAGGRDGDPDSLPGPGGRRRRGRAPEARRPAGARVRRRYRPCRASPWYWALQSERWSLPDDVLGRLPGRTSTTSSGRDPDRVADPVDDRVAERGSGRRPWSRPRRRCPPCPGGPAMPKAITLPARTPSTPAAARSISSGYTLRPPTMMTSLMRPQTTTSPSTR